MDSTLSTPSLSRVIRRVGRDVLQAVFPELCLHCGDKIVDRDFFCGACAPRQGFGPLPHSGTNKQYLTFMYEGALKTLFGAAKFSHRRRARQYFAKAATEDLRRFDEISTLYVSLPSRSEFLQKILQKAIPKGRLIRSAFRVRRSALGNNANKLLGEADRYKRIHESLIWNAATMPPAERYILCDDVSTTGATLHHAAHLLKKYLPVREDQIILWSLMFQPRVFAPPP